MVKKQQMQGTHEGAHYLLQTRTAGLNGDLQNIFERWYPDLKTQDLANNLGTKMKVAA